MNAPKTAATTPLKKLCLIDDDEHTLHVLGGLCEELGHPYECFGSAKAALLRLEENHSAFSLVICDYKMPQMNGMEFFAELSKNWPGLPVILVSSFGTTEIMYDALNRGIFDFVQKPFNFRELEAVIKRARRYYDLEQDYRQLQRAMAGKKSEDDFIGASEAIKRVKDVIERVAHTSASVLILGQTGTGKELVAKSIHEQSSRKEGPLIIVNCAAIPEGLIESELFGHEKGSFTGATEKKIGLFQAAGGGSIFLDEIGDLPLLMQSKILRVLQEGKVRSVGSSKETKINVRVLAATHKDIKTMIKRGEFREDLYYRLNVVSLQVPPLKDRKDDIPLLCAHFLKKFKRIHSSQVKAISPSALQKLVSYDWPGNIRELQNTIERSIVMCRENMLGESDILMGGHHHENGGSEKLKLEFSDLPSLKEIEKRYIAHVLNHTAGKREEAAGILGINRKTLYSKIKEYHLSP